MDSLFRSESGREAIFKLYDQKLEALNITYDTRFINTSFGKTHVIVTGDSANPPLVLVHGSNGCAPIALECYPNLSSKFQVFAVDVLAQPNKSAESRLSMKDDAYGHWMNETIEGLGLDKVVLAGFSLGGLVILKTLASHGDKVQEAFLAAPAYIVNGNPLAALLKVFIPMRKYMRTKNVQFIEQFLGVLFSQRDPFAIDFLSQVFLHFDMDFTPVPVISKKEAQKITTPITLIAAGDDLLFPGKKMIKRAKKLLPSIHKMVLLENSKHVQTTADNHSVEQLILQSIKP